MFRRPIVTVVEPANSTTGTDVPIATIVLGLVVIAGLFWFLNSPAAVRIAEAELIDDRLTAIVSSCGGELTLDVYEDDGLVLVRVLDHRFRFRLSGNACQDRVPIPLSVPLGQRDLVDESTGRHVPVMVWDS